MLGAGCPPVSVNPPPFTPYTNPAVVAAVKGTNLGQMARDALDAIGGAGHYIDPGERVFIKPNLGSVGLSHHNTVTSGESTKPEIIVAVAEECLKAGAEEVIIGDAAQVDSFDWTQVKTLNGASSLAAEAQRLSTAYGKPVRLACLHADSPAWDPIPSPYTALGEIKISSLAARADKVISLPVIKTHRWCQITGAIKNFMGVTSLQDYGGGMQMRSVLHGAGLEQSFLDIAKALRPAFTIVDGSICCEGNGPHVLPGWWGTTLDLRDSLGQWVVLGSADCAAADTVAAQMIGLDPAAIKTLQFAHDQGFGQTQPDQITLSGERLADISTPFKPADLTEGFWEVIIPGIAMMLE